MPIQGPSRHMSKAREALRDIGMTNPGCSQAPPTYAAEEWGHDFRAVVWQLQQLQCRLEDGLRPWDPERLDHSSASKVASLVAENERLREEVQRLRRRSGDPEGCYQQNDNASSLCAKTCTSVPDSPTEQKEGADMVGNMPTKTSGESQAQSSMDCLETGSECMDVYDDAPNRMSSTVSVSAISPDAPHRAIVVNARRLIQAHKTLEIMHELIKSTAVAALTLAAAGTQRQFRVTLMFIACVVIIYALHDRRWDRLDVEDMRTLLPLLSDDIEPESKVEVDNPNRVLKAMSYTDTSLWFWLKLAIHILGFIMCSFAWMILVVHWGLWGQDRPEIVAWKESFIKEEDDGNVVGMQVMVGSLMFVLHMVFEFANYYEMCCVMPRTAGHGVWDPRKHGIPWRYRFLGLPSMWFTSNEALHDLKYWIDTANPVSRVSQIYPQEIAFYAMLGHDEREHLHTALKSAKLFDGSRRKFLPDETGSRRGRSLDIELCFFDPKLKRVGCKYAGEFLTLGESDCSSSTKSRATMVARKQEIAVKDLMRNKGTAALNYVNNNVRWRWLAGR